jgi:hypothetical protein
LRLKDVLPAITELFLERKDSAHAQHGGDKEGGNEDRRVRKTRRGHAFYLALSEPALQYGE